MAPYIQNTLDELDASAKRQAAHEAVVEGAEAPDFTLPTPDGSTLSLHDFRGRWVMLDFWGSWCVWCIRGIPTLKELYAKYSDKIEFLSIACNDTDEKWRAAMEKNQMPWLQAFNLENTDNDVDTKMGIQAYPSFYFINPDGKIAKIFVGESDEFKQFFRDTFK